MDLFKLLQNDETYFTHQTILPFTVEMEQEVNMFSYSKIWHSSTSIRVADIIGTIHPNYAGKSWLWLLQNGIRMHINLPLLVDNPIYYDEAKVKEPKMYFRVVDNGKLYIDADGNHRSCIAKFYHYFKATKDAMLHGVEVVEYLISHEHKYIYNELNSIIQRNKLALVIDVLRTCTKRDDTPGFMQEHYDIKVIARSYRYGISKEVTTGILQELLDEESMMLRKYRSKNKWFWR